MEGISISQISTSYANYGQVWNLREEVLRKPLGLSLKNEDLSRDATNIIFVAKYDNDVIGCVFLQPIDNKGVQLRQMAVYDQWQGKGIGRELVLACEEYAAQNNIEIIILHARKVAVGFYTSLGYMLAGDEFSEVGIPHFMMEKRIKK